MKRLVRHQYWKNFNIFLLTALVSVSSGLSAINVHAGDWTSLGTRAKLAEPNVPITTPAGISWEEYGADRPEDYPKVYTPDPITEPLQYITMSDGVRLAVRVARPADASGNPVPGQFPVVLQITDYQEELSNLLPDLLQRLQLLEDELGSLGAVIGAYDPYLVKRGYINVSVDGRGTGNSEGVWKFFDPAHEANDNKEILDWIVAQDWSTGKVGVTGVSDVSWHALFAAGTGHDAIQGAVIIVGGTDAYRDILMTGGQGNASFITTWFALTSLVVTANPQLLVDPGKAFPDVLEKHLQSATEGSWNIWFKTLLEGDPELVYDTDFYAQRSSIELADEMKAPTFLISSASDLFVRGIPMMYEQLKDRTDAQGNPIPTKLLMGELGHAQTSLNFGLAQQGVPTYNQIQLRWFDQYVKGIDDRAGKLPNVTQFVQDRHWGALSNLPGKGRYVTSTDWPHPKATAKRYYLRSNAASLPLAPAPLVPQLQPVVPVPATALHRGGLTTAKPVSPGRFDYEEKRKNRPVFLTTGVLSNTLTSACSPSLAQWQLGAPGFIPVDCFFDNRYTDFFSIVYETEPLQQDMYINGPILADLWVSSSNLSQDVSSSAVSVRVSNVDQLGNAIPIGNGLQALKHRAVDPSRSRYLDGQMIQPWHPFTQAAEQSVPASQVLAYPLRSTHNPVNAVVEVFPSAVLLKKGHKLRVSISPGNYFQGIPVSGDLLNELLNWVGTTTVYNEPDYPSSIVIPVVPTSELPEFPPK